MRRRFVKGVVAATAAVVLTVSGTARPAQASWASWAAVAVSVAQSLRSGGGDLERAKREIIAAVENAKQDILNHIDTIAAADVQACTEAAVTKIAQIDSMPGSLLGPFVNGAVDCAALSKSYLNAVQSLPAADTIGKLMGVIYAIAMVGFAKYGLSTTALLDGLISGYQAVVTKLAPTCNDQTIREYDSRGRVVTVEIQHTCVAYNGDQAWDSELYYRGKLQGPPLDRAQINMDATRNTSRWIAQQALPTLQTIRAGA
ncbi:hypothetical protein Drose_35060 [Dactylosporangium roseum]|uniref:Uncharacterized protein n=1 Tax=Dactylosporangium roseum TaxID=47989 RepID=A0ABY5Z2I4_9ACTN|nr:hypothetical protein [Dactylosporangium roseum]UWZ36220.1 hypothetical protein Drose_35060 [Dactylosporangium roseum]